MGLGRCHSPPQKGEEGRSNYLRELADSYGAVLALQPDHAGAYVALGEGLRMYGLQGGCEEFGGKGALQMYQHALDLLPDNTCALTHVAFGHRPPCGQEQLERLSMMSGVVGGAEACAAAQDGAVAPDEDEDEDDGTPPTIASLSCPTPPATEAELQKALSRWRRNGLAVFPSLLTDKEVESLLAHVRIAQAGNHTKDYTAVTRDKASRCHKALPVDEARPALEAIATRLQPFLDAALGTAAPALLESGFMVTAPGAAGQNFHRDVAPAVVSRSSMTVSIQVSLVDTAADQGALEVIPRSQAYDPTVTDRTRAEAMDKVAVAVPKGSVTVYALHTMHRGSANTNAADRPFYFFTLTGLGLAPPGLAYTIQPADVGQYEMVGGALQPLGTARVS